MFVIDMEMFEVLVFDGNFFSFVVNIVDNIEVI